MSSELPEKHLVFITEKISLWGSGMEKISKIMVPVAFSEHSVDLIRYAASIANALDAEMILVNIINEKNIEIVQKITSYGYNVDEEHYTREIETERMAELKTILEDIDFPLDRIRFIFKVGRPAKTLLNVAVKEQVDMIIMGIRDRTDFLHTLTGSVAEKVFRRSPVTIVSFRDEKNAGYLRKRLED